jgi:hypothetical protein
MRPREGMPRNVESKLCVYDFRNPFRKDLEACFGDDIPKARQNECGCDSCFYGTDILANELLRLMDVVEELQDQQKFKTKHTNEQ